MANKKILAFVFLTLFLLPLAVYVVSAAEPATISWADVIHQTNGKFLDYITGKIASVTQDNIQNAVITSAVFLLIFLTFADIISVFSSFTPWISWVVAFLISVIIANTSLPVKMIVALTSIFAVLGTAAVYVGLGTAFLAFLLVNMGVRRARKWVVRRRAMMAASGAHSGGRITAGTIRGLGQMGEALEDVGSGRVRGEGAAPARRRRR